MSEVKGNSEQTKKSKPRKTNEFKTSYICPKCNNEVTTKKIYEIKNGYYRICPIKKCREKNCVYKGPSKIVKKSQIHSCDLCSCKEYNTEFSCYDVYQCYCGHEKTKHSIVNQSSNTFSKPFTLNSALKDGIE